MDKIQKRLFIIGCLEMAKITLLEKVDKMPENWSGAEIRELMSDYFDQSRMLYDQKRKNNFRNDCLTLNL